MSQGRQLLIETACMPGQNTGRTFRPLDGPAKPFQPSVKTHTVTVSASIHQINSFGVLVKEISWQLSPEMVLSASGQRKLAERIVSTIMFLSEPLGMVEYDPDSEILLVRSMPPLQNAKGIYYFEFQIGGESLVSFRRYHWSPETQDRMPFSHYLSEDRFVRLVDNVIREIDSAGPNLGKKSR